MEKPRICAHTISAHDLGKTYGEVTALTGVSVTAEAGRVLGVLGHNGAGKTTLVDILATRVAPTTGRAEVCGFDVLEDARPKSDAGSGWPRSSWPWTRACPDARTSCCWPGCSARDAGRPSTAPPSC